MNSNLFFQLVIGVWLAVTSLIYADSLEHVYKAEMLGLLAVLMLARIEDAIRERK